MPRKLEKKGLICVISLMISIFWFQIAQAQEYPIKPVTLVIPVSPGGSHDLTARAVTSVAADYLGQPIIIQTKPGGGGAIGTELVLKAPPDGYTLLMGGPAWNSTLPAVEGRSRGPDDMAAVCRINYSVTTVIARSDAPFKTFKEMLEWAKANPGKMIFGSTGPWSTTDLAWKQIMKQTGITTKVVPHDGGGPVLISLLGGQIDATATVVTAMLPHIKAGKLRVLAILDNKRDPGLPDVPTAKEEGVDVVNLLWRGVIAPKGTPRPIIDKLASAFKKMTEDKSVTTMISRFGDSIYYLGTDEFAKFWRAEYEAHKELGKIYKK